MARILVVDDDELSIDVPCQILARIDHKVLTASNGVEALATYRRNPPDLVITDILMPGMNGLELIRHLRGINPEAKILAVAGMGDAVLTDAALDGADRTLAKPYRVATLTNAVEDLQGA